MFVASEETTRNAAFTLIGDVRMIGGSLLIAATLLQGTTPTSGASDVVIKFSHAASIDSAKGKGAARFAELVSEYSHGQVTVNVYPNSSLVEEREEFDALFTDRVQMLAPPLTNLARRGIREFEVFNLPFLFSDMASVRRLADSPIGQKLLRKLEPRGLIGLGYWHNGFNLISSNKPIVAPGDMAALKILIDPWHMTMATQLRTLGATPQIAPISKWNSMLRDGDADGAIVAPLDLENFKLYEVQQHATVSNHSYSGFVLLISGRFWERLSWDQKDAITRAAKETGPVVDQLAEAANEASIVRMKASRGLVLHRLTNTDVGVWKSALDVAQQINAFRAGAGLANDVLQMNLHAPR